MLLIALLIAAVRLIGPRDQASGGASHQSARQILDQRFARGEIDEDEYRSRVKMLPDSLGRRTSMAVLSVRDIDPV